MMKFIREFASVLLAFSLLLSAAAGEEVLSFEEAWALAAQGVNLDLADPEDTLLIPEDCTGFEVQAGAGQASALASAFGMEPAVSGDGAICSFPLTEDSARALFEKAECLSMGPGGACLYFAPIPSGGVLFVRRDKVLTPLLQAADRGAADEYGNLERVLDYKLNGSPTIVSGPVRWSPDGRYLFIFDRDLWLGTRMDVGDPYLTDTVTGEIFLLETNPKPDLGTDGPCRYVMNGRFSADGGSFFYLLRVKEPDSDIRGVLMRWDAETGETETVLETADALHDFCELGKDRWLLLTSASDGEILRVTMTEEGLTVDREPLPFAGNSVLYPVSGDLAFLLATEGRTWSSLLLPVRWDGSGPWIQVRDLSADMLGFLTAEEAAAEYERAHQFFTVQTEYAVISGSIPGFGSITAVHLIDGTPLAALDVRIAVPVVSNWPGRQQTARALILLDTGTLQGQVIYRDRSLISLFSYDEIVYGNRWLNSRQSIGDPFLYGLCRSAEESEVISDGWYGVSDDGEYITRLDLIVTPSRTGVANCTLDYTDLRTTVKAISDEPFRYQVSSVFTRHPEPETVVFRLPEAISEERFKAFASAMSKSDSKKVGAAYYKLTPEKAAEKANGQELLASYPALASETLYILKEDLDPTKLEYFEQKFADAGYTPEDFELDSANVAVSRETNAYIDRSKAGDSFGNISYVFSDVDSYAFPRTVVDQLVRLCDRINSTVYRQYLRPEGDPVPVESLIAESYEIDGAVWHVALSRTEDTGKELMFILSVLPE